MVQVDRPPVWISYWAAFSCAIVAWDAGYCFLRPRSFPDGDLAWIWAPYNAVPYTSVDLLYGYKGYEENDGFTNAQALLNVIELILNLEYLYLRHTSPRSTRAATSANVERYHGHAPLVGFASALMTTAKTALYILQEYYCGWCNTAQNDRFNFWVVWVLTNGTWVLVPFIVTIALGRFIAKALNRQYASDAAYIEWAKEHPKTTSATLAKKIEVQEPFTDKSEATSEEEEVKVTVNGHDVARSRNGLVPETPRRLLVRSMKSTAGAGVVDVAASASLSANSPLPTKAANAYASSSTSPYPVPHSGAALPLTFHPANLPVLVVGHNRLAASRAFSFLESDAEVTIASPQPLSSAHEEIQHRVHQSQLDYLEIECTDQSGWIDFLRTKKFALVCVTDTMIGSSTGTKRSSQSAQFLFQAALSLSIPINISDYPTFSTFTFPSVHRFAGTGGPSHLQVAVSTNGRGCRLSGRIKRDIVTKLPSVVGAAVDNVGRLRQRAKSKARIISEDDIDTPINTPVPQLDTPSLLHQASFKLSLPVDENEQQLRRMRWVHQMSEYYSLEALARMTEQEMDRALETWQGDALPHHDGAQQAVVTSSRTTGRISLIGSGPGHPSLLTVAALHSLRHATLILSDKLVPSEILALIPPTTKLHIAKKFPGNNEGAQNEMMLLALEGARAGEDVVRLKQGDPFVYGRGGEEVLYFRENGYECTVIPGVSSALAGPLMMGIPVTQRGVAESMILCTGVGRQGKSVQLPGYVKARTTCILMGVARIASIVSVLTSAVSPGRDGPAYPSYLPIAIIERASSPDQRVILSTLGDVEEALKSVEERPPGMMIVGWAGLCLEGEGRVDILDLVTEEEEASVVKQWMGTERWKIREGLGGVWGEFMKTVEEVHGSVPHSS